MKFIIALVLLAAQYTFAGYVNTQALNKTLEKNHSGWVAQDNWVNQQSKSDIKRMLGLREAPSADIQFTVPAELQTKDVLPSSLDWRNYHGQNWVSPILNQANCGSCVAFAAIGVLESQVNISSLIPGLNEKFSPQFLFSCGGGACDYGWMPGAAASFLMRTGAPDEACLPYTSGANAQDVTCKTACSDAKSRTQKISNFSTPSRSARDINAVKKALLKGPVMTTLTVYADFITYAGGVYKRTSKDALGGHAVSIVGYDDATQSWIIRNSWGVDWGEQGFAHVAYSDDSGISTSTWGFDIPAVSGYVSTLFPRDYSYMSGKMDMSASSSFQKTANLKFNVTDANNRSVTVETCATSQCSVSVDTSALQDGRYEVETIAEDGAGQTLAKSNRQFFYVINSQPSMNLTFKGASGVNLSQPVSGRIEFEVNAQSAPVPMSTLEFHLKSLATGKEETHVSEIVLDKMLLGFRTPRVANGSYEIWFVGKINAGVKEAKVESVHQTIKVQN